MIKDMPVSGVAIVTRPHPSGKKGAHISLQEVADRAWKARMSPRLRAWATKVIADAGVSRGGRREKAQAILDAYRKKVPYVNDPVMGEFIATPEQTLCLDEGGLCIIGGDCDDASVTLAGAMLSIGIPAQIIGSSHKDPLDVPTHVYVAFEDDIGDWIPMDGTTRYPVGYAVPHARQWQYEPGKEAKERGEGDFVGMAGAKAGGDLDGPPTLLDLLYPGIR